MGLRFRKSFKLAPGVRFNLSSKGASLSLGPRGFAYTTGTSGSRINVGLPGPVSYAARTGSSPPNEPSRQSGDIAIRARLDEDGQPEFLSEEGAPMPPRIVKQVFALKGDAIREWLEENAVRFNEEGQKIADIHLDSPEPIAIAPMKPDPFPLERPMKPAQTEFLELPPLEPVPAKIGLLSKLIPGRQAHLERKRPDPTV